MCFPSLHRRSLGCLLFSLLLLNPAIQAENRLLIGAGDPWPPYVDPDLPNQGVAVEIVTAALATQGLDLEWQNMPWANAMYGVRDVEYDVLVGAWYTEERSEFLRYSEPYIDNDVRIIMRADDAFEFRDVSDLAGKRIGTVLGYGYGDDFNRADNYIPEPAVNLVTNVRRLLRYSIDLTLEDELVARYLLNEIDPELLEDIRFSEVPVMSNSLHLAVGRAHPDADFIIDSFNVGLQAIRDSGEFDAILAAHDLDGSGQ